MTATKATRMMSSPPREHAEPLEQTPPAESPPKAKPKAELEGPPEPAFERIDPAHVQPLPRLGFRTNANGTRILEEVIVHAFGVAAGSAFAVCERADGLIKQYNTQQIRFR